MVESYTKIKNQAERAVIELLARARLSQGDILVAGCSSSEVTGERIGTASSLETAQAVFEGIYGVVQEKGIYLAAQCCEHLNRAIIIERELAARERIPDIHARLRSDMLHCNGLYKSLISRCCKGAACLWLWNYIYNRNPLSCRQLSFNNNRSV